MWRRGAHSDAAHRLPTADSSPAAVRRRRRPALTCRPSHLFFGLVVALCVASFLGVWELVPIGDGDAAAAAPPPPPTSSGGAMRFSPSRMALRAFDGESRLEAARSAGRWWPGLAPVRLALVVGTMDVDAQSLMLATLARSLTGLGYEVQVLAFADGEAHDIWMHICGHVHVMSSEGLKSVDWSRYNAILVSSLEGKRVISILMQETFQFLPVVWLIHEDFLGQHLRSYAELPLSMPSHVEDWRAHFNACAYVVFPDSYIPLLYSPLDTGNFLVIPGSPVDIWAAKRYGALHSQESLRNQHGIKEDDVVILVVGSYLFFDELPWDYAAVMRASAQQILEMARSRNFRVQFVFFCGNATDAYDSAFQELASHMAFPDGSVKHFSMTHDTKELFLLADIVLYGSLRQEPGFPPLLLRSMASEMPIIAPNLTIITKYVRDGIHGFLFDSDDPSTMATAFLRMLGGKKLSDSAYSVALEGKLLSKSMLAYDCITAHVKLLESVIHYPSDAKLPSSVSEIQERTWLWDLFEMKAALRNSSSENDSHIRRSIIDFLEGESPQSNRTASYDSNGTSYDYPSLSDWDDLSEAEIFEDIERREMQEIEERVEKPLLSWDEVYRNARKSERLKPEGNERDEGELERTGQPVCIYEVYIGEGAWSFLHHGSLYRGITLSKGGRRPRSDDVDAVSRLAVLDSPHYRDLLCEFGAMFAIANRVDTVHKLPWIGFQTWRAAGRKVSLSKSAETTLEEAVAEENHEDVIYYWVPMDMDQHSDDKINLNFWSMCDCLNAGHCRTLFEDAFRTMYGLPEGVVALPPMPSDGDYWSTLHSWVMPTPSFLKFIMFSRMFVDSLHRLNQNRNQNSSGPASCLLGASQPEKRRCYCRILEVLVNVWAYHSGRKMVYLNPITGGVKEQHPREERQEMWVKFFNYTLLKSMDEDLAEEADDGMHPEQDQWLWPLTGQVFWPGMADREREEKYIRKMDKKIKSKVKLLERQKSGYKQKPLGQGQ